MKLPKELLKSDGGGVFIFIRFISAKLTLKNKLYTISCFSAAGRHSSHENAINFTENSPLNLRKGATLLNSTYGENKRRVLRV